MDARNNNTNVMVSHKTIALKAPKRMVPQLRFNEFEGDGFTKNNFEDIFHFSTGKNIKQNEASPEFDIPCVRYGELYHMYNEVIHEVVNKTNLDRRELKFSDGDEILLPSAGEDPLDIGSASALTIKNIAIGRTINVLKPKHELVYSQIYASYYINQKLKRKIASLAKGVSISNVYNSDLKGLNITLPSLPEQQKIAQFLTAVDSKLQQLNQKKELLAQYKKGVMQQLFSQQLRFKKDDGSNYPDWDEKRLHELIEFSNGKAHEQDIDETGKYVVVNSKFISSNGEVRKYCNTQVSPLKKGDIVMVMSDIPNGKALAKCFLIDENNKYSLNQRICGLKQKNVVNDFLIYILNRNKYYLKFDSGVGQTNLKKGEVLNCPLLIPSSKQEQQKIANYLSAIDSKIETVTQQIEATQQFKKGLLQQMFV